MDPARPLDVFVHIPKTAGSTLNALLLRHHAARRSPRLWGVARGVLPGAVIENSVTGRWLSLLLAGGCSHLEMHGGTAFFDRVMARADWVSAHLSARRLRRQAEAAGRTPRLFTVVREPVAQLASHYQWWIEIHDRGPWRYWRYDRRLRDLSARIRATDNRDPRAVIAVLEDHAPLFLNLQARYVLGPPGADLSALRAFEALGVDDDLGGVARAMTGEAPPLPRLNRSVSRFDRSVFEAPEMRRFLRARHAEDLALHEAVRATRPPSS